MSSTERHASGFYATISFLKQLLVLTPRYPRHHAEDTLQAIANVAIRQARNFEAFVADRPLHQLVECNLENISEGSRRIPDYLKVLEPDIPWCEMVGISATTIEKCAPLFCGALVCTAWLP